MDYGKMLTSPNPECVYVCTHAHVCGRGDRERKIAVTLKPERVKSPNSKWNNGISGAEELLLKQKLQETT